MKKIVAVIIIALMANNALATVCFETPNPCKDAASCEKISDFVFEAVFEATNDEQFVNVGDGTKTPNIATRKKALFKVTSWVKGKPLHDPTLINDYIMDDRLCGGVKPVGNLVKDKKYRIYGYYHGSKNNEKIFNEKYPSSGPRTERRYYLKFEPIEQ